jgi:hypothetical protein
VKLAGWLRPDRLLLLIANFGERQPAKVALDLAKLGWTGKTVNVTDAEAGYKQMTNRRIRKSDAELAADKARFEQAEAAKASKNPNYEPRPYKENPWRNEPVVAWDGDKNAPVHVNGATLTVPVERHNYRLLTVEAR